MDYRADAGRPVEVGSPSKTHSDRLFGRIGVCMAQTTGHRIKVAVLWRGDHQARLDVRPETSRFHAIFTALAAKGIDARPAVYSEEWADQILEELLRMDGVLVWVDPISGGKRRDFLDQLLRELPAAGVFVSTDPDVIAKMGGQGCATSDQGARLGNRQAFLQDARRVSRRVSPAAHTGWSQSPEAEPRQGRLRCVAG
jgi:hypothetical protein